MRNGTAVVLLIVGALVARSLWSQFRFTSRHHRPTVGANVLNQQSSSSSRAAVVINTTKTTTTASSRSPRTRCAICLFGLPRAFASLVLPSLVKNVIRPNARHGCDYFVHYYNVTHEEGGRSGGGGTVQADDILRLAGAVDRAAAASAFNGGAPLGGYRRRPVTRFAVETDGDFWTRRGALVRRVRTANDTEGRFLYFPWRARSYRHPATTDNILKMWHSIQG
jgi:hypothetical protein